MRRVEQLTETRVESVEKALSILEAFSAERRSLTSTEIAKETGPHNRNVSRLAGSLARYGYLKCGSARTLTVRTVAATHGEPCPATLGQVGRWRQGA